MSKSIDKAIRLCDASNHSRSFFSKIGAEIFVEQLKKQGIKATITGVEDKRNGVYVYRVTWN